MHREPKRTKTKSSLIRSRLSHPFRSPKSRNALLLSAWLIAVATLAGFLAQSQQRTRDEINSRFALRAEIASRFIVAYLDDLITRQRDIAEQRLSSPVVGERLFQRAAADGGYEAAVLLDDQGRLLRIAPPSPKLVGTDLTRDYEHLRRAVAGHTSVSKIVPSAARGFPVVAFAVPFPTSSGRRVYSGAHDLALTPLGAYLRNAIQIKPNRVYLIDDAGQVIAKNGPSLGAIRNLGAQDRQLAQALRSHPEGSYDSPAGSQRYASQAVPGTPWRIVISVPSDLIYRSVGGANFWLPWIAIAAFALGGLMVIWLLSRLMDSRIRLAKANTDLKRLSRLDPLTGLHNRRYVEEVLHGLMSAGDRHHINIAVLLVDIDHFKAVNDTYGHEKGDDVLCATAEVITDMLRTEDVIARWGGEEFLIVLPGVGEASAKAAAERIRARVEESRVAISSREEIGVTVTIGIAIQGDETVEQLIGRADGALYEGKAAGRNTVRTASGPAEIAV